MPSIRITCCIDRLRAMDGGPDARLIRAIEHIWKPASRDSSMDRAQIPTELKADILSEALPYIRRFHGRTIVVKYGGNAMIDQALKESFAHDVVLLKLVGMKPVVVHGGGPQIDDALERLGKKSRFVQSMRGTHAETMEILEWGLAGQGQQELVMPVNRFAGQAVRLPRKN